MRRTGLMFDLRFRDHDPGPGHPERAERTEALGDLFAADGYRSLARVSARLALEEEIERVHDRALFAAVAESSSRAHTRFDPDTAASWHTFDTALLAAGGSIELADAIMDGSADNGLAAVRPPGHHAERDRPMGFCFFNNVAIVARHLLDRRGLERVLILDWDVHHGNGTQHAFWRDPRVLYASLHQYPYYPGTGASADVGAGPGAGYTVNLPMAAGSGPDEYMTALQDVLLPVARAFSPQFVLVSAGFDAHRDDPLASIRLDEAAFAAMTDAVCELADDCCGGRVEAVLEGGYELSALCSSIAAMIERFQRPRPFKPTSQTPTRWAAATREALRPYWDL